MNENNKVIIFIKIRLFYVLKFLNSKINHIFIVYIVEIEIKRYSFVLIY